MDVAQLKRGHGFTLLELLISLSILSVVVVLIMGTFRIGIRAWEKGEADIDAQQSYRAALDRLSQQIASVCVRKINEGGRKSYYLNGTSTEMRFFSEVALVPHNEAGLTYVHYRIEEKQQGLELLTVYETAFDWLGEDEEIEQPKEEQFLALMAPVFSMRFSYLNQDEENDDNQWQDNWEPDEMRPQFPLAIKIEITTKEGDAPIVGIARILATST
jgi:general secretion pathway protein J